MGRTLSGEKAPLFFLKKRVDKSEPFCYNNCLGRTKGAVGRMEGTKEQSAEEKKKELYERQKELLDTFLAHHAITKAQYDKSLGDLTVKMGFAAGKQE